MARNDQVTAKFRVDGQQAKNDVSSLKDSFKSSFTEINSGFQLAKLGLDAFESGLSSVSSAVKNWIDLASEQEKLQQRLATAVQLRQSFDKSDLDIITKLNKELEAKTGVDKNSLLQLQGTLAELGIAPVAFDRASKAAIAFADITNTDVVSAAKTVGKIFAGEVPKALAKFGVDVKSGGEALQFLVDRFPVAAQHSDTFAGSIDRLKNAWRDFQEDLGTAIIENRDVKQLISDLIDKMHELTGTVDDGRPKLDQFISSFVQGIRDIANTLQEHAGEFKLLLELLVAVKGLQAGASIASSLGSVASGLGGIAKTVGGIGSGAGAGEAAAITGTAWAAAGTIFGAAAGVALLGAYTKGTLGSMPSQADVSSHLFETQQQYDARMGALSKHDSTPFRQTAFAQNGVLPTGTGVDFAEGEDPSIAANSKSLEALKKQAADAQRFEKQVEKAFDDMDAVIRAKEIDHAKFQEDLSKQIFENKLSFVKHQADIEKQIQEGIENDRFEEQAKWAFMRADREQSAIDRIREIKEHGTETEHEMALRDLQFQKSTQEQFRQLLVDGIANTMVMSVEGAIEGKESLGKAIENMLGGLLISTGTMLVQLGTAGLLGATLGTFIPFLAPVTGGPAAVVPSLAAIAGGLAMVGVGAAMGGGGASASAPSVSSGGSNFGTSAAASTPNFGTPSFGSAPASQPIVNNYTVNYTGTVVNGNEAQAARVLGNLLQQNNRLALGRA